MLAENNCDLNCSSATMLYHGTSLTIMKFPTEENKGEEISKPVIETPRSTSNKASLFF